MKDTRIMMGMPITVEVVDSLANKQDIESVYEYFEYIDKKFSTYKKNSEMMKINRKEINTSNYSNDMKVVLALCQKTKEDTKGFFDIQKNNFIDPSGLVKGWSVYNACKILKNKGYKNYYIDAGGDIQVSGKNSEGKKWLIGIRNPFNRTQNVKILRITGKGIATSGTAIRGEHIYDPHKKDFKSQMVSLTVIGPNVYEADRFATAAFAMQKDGILFIESLKGFEGYMIDYKGIATFTNGFDKYILQS